MWLFFKFQLSASRTGHVILALKDLVEGKIHPRQATKARRQSRCIVLLSLTSVLGGYGWSTRHRGRFTIGIDPIPFVYEAGWTLG